MTEIVKLYFQWPNGLDDCIELETDTLEEMKLLIEKELNARNAIHTGIESIQECSE